MPSSRPYSPQVEPMNNLDLYDMQSNPEMDRAKMESQRNTVSAVKTSVFSMNY